MNQPKKLMPVINDIVNRYPLGVLCALYFVLLLLMAGGADPAYMASIIPVVGLPRLRPSFLYDKPDDSGGKQPPEGNSETPAGASLSNGDTAGNTRTDLHNDPILKEAMSATAAADGREPEGSEKSKVKSQRSEEEPEQGGEGSEEQGEKETKQQSGKETKKQDEEEAEFNEGIEEDLVDIGDKTFFYHPDEHGKDSGQGTTYPDRDVAEHGFANKVSKIKADLQELNETDLGIGPVDLPEWVEQAITDPDKLDELMEVDYAIGQPNDDLRAKINEADGVITQFNNRKDQLHGRKKTAENTQQLQQLQQQAETQSSLIRDDLDYSDAELQGFGGDVDKLRSDIEARVDKMVAGELEEDATELQQLMDADIDTRAEDGYAKRLVQKKEDLIQKKDQLQNAYREKYLGAFDELQSSIDEANKLQEGVAKDTGLTTGELQEKQENSYDDYQTYLSNLPVDQQPIWFRASSEKGQNDFWGWAAKRASKFNNLTSSYWFKKANEAYQQEKADLRAKARQQQIEDANAEKEKKDKEIQGYGDQNKLSKKKNQKPNQRADMQSELDELTEETKETINS